MNKETYFELRKELDFSVKNRFYLKAIATDLFVISSIFWLGSRFSFFYALALPVLLFRSFGYMHEAVHGVLHRNPAVNDTLGIIHGAICFLPFQQWKKIHVEHHLWAGNPEKDPTLEIVKKFEFLPAKKKDELNFFWKTQIPFIAFLQQVVFWKFSVDLVLKKKVGLVGAASALAPAILWGAVLILASWPSLLFMAIGVVGYLALIEFINWPHHLDTYEVHEKPMPRWEQAKIARSCRYPRFFERHVALNFNFHSEHHLFPELPWHQLEQLHQRLLVTEPLLQVSLNSSWLKGARAQHISEIMKYEHSSSAKQKAS